MAQRETRPRSGLGRTPDGDDWQVLAFLLVARRTQELMVSAVTKNTLAACSKDQPRLARSSRIAIRSVAG